MTVSPSLTEVSAALRSVDFVTSKESAKADLAPAGRLSTSGTGPTSMSDSLLWPWLANTPPKSTRNISGKKTEKNTACRSRR